MRKILTISAVTAAIVLGAAAPALATTVNIGGGTWNYGTSYVFPVSEGVYSDYYHPSNHHSGTSICAANNVTVHAAAGSWANSSTSCGYGGATHALYNPND